MYDDFIDVNIVQVNLEAIYWTARRKIWFRQTLSGEWFENIREPTRSVAVGVAESEMSQKLSWRDLFVQIELGVDIASLGIK